MIQLVDEESGNAHARNSDPASSKQSGRRSFKTGKLRVVLLMLTHYRESGYTAREVEVLSKHPINVELFRSLMPLGTNPWSRFSDAKQAGWIEPTGYTRVGDTGQPQEVYQINDAGRQAVMDEWKKK